MHQILIQDWIGFIIIRGRHVELFARWNIPFHDVTPFALYKKENTLTLLPKLLIKKTFGNFPIFSHVGPLVKSFVTYLDKSHALYNQTLIINDP